MTSAIAPVTYAGPESRARRSREQLQAAGLPSTSTSTVTPDTIRITPHGIELDRLLLVGRARQREHRRADERAHAHVDRHQQRARISAPMTARVSRCAARSRAPGALHLRRPPSAARSAAQQRQPAEQEIAGEGDGALGGERVEEVAPSPVPGMPARAIRSLRDDPGRRQRRERPGVGAVGQHHRHQEAAMPARPAMPMATGASSAVAAMLPAPIGGQRRRQHEEDDRGSGRRCRAPGAPRARPPCPACR